MQQVDRLPIKLTCPLYVFKRCEYQHHQKQSSGSPLPSYKHQAFPTSNMEEEKMQKKRLGYIRMDIPQKVSVNYKSTTKWFSLLQ